MCPREFVREEDAYAWYGVDDRTGKARWRSNYLVYDIIYEALADYARENGYPNERATTTAT